MQTRQTNSCPVCGKGKLREVTGTFSAKMKGIETSSETLTVPNVTWQQCDSCGEELLNHTASQAITGAHRQALGLLTVEELRSLRSRLGKTQSQMSDLLGIGEKTYCRWESGTHFQSEGFDRYLRLLLAGPENIELLNDIRREKEGNQISPTEFQYLGDISSFETTNQRFTELLLLGPFRVLQGA